MAYDPLKDGIITRSMLVGHDGSGNYVEVPVLAGSGSLLVSINGAVFATNDPLFTANALVVRTIPSQIHSAPVVVANDKFESASEQVIGLTAQTYSALIGGINGDGTQGAATMSADGGLRVSTGGKSTFRYFGATATVASAGTSGLIALSIRSQPPTNTITLHLKSVSFRFSAEGWLELRKSPTFSVEPTWGAVDTDSIADSGDATGTWTAGTGLPVLVLVGGTVAQSIDISAHNIRLAPGETLTVIAHSEATTIDARVSLNWHEEF